MGMKLLVLHGPNLQLRLEQEDGGGLDALNRALREKAAELGVELKVVQSNHEGVLVDTLHAERQGLGGVVVNPMGLFGSHVLREALELVDAPAIEVTLGAKREDSVVAEACAARLGGRGRGFDAYLEALERLASGEVEAEEEEEESEDEASEREESRVKKTLGRKSGAARERPAAQSEKSLGRKPDALVSAPAKALARTVDATPVPQKAQKAGKSLGRGARGASASDFLTRAMVREKIADKLSGRLSAAELAAWARTRWNEVQRGAPAESGYRELLEDSLQSLTLSSIPASRLSDEQLVEMMTQLEG